MGTAFVFGLGRDKFVSFELTVVQRSSLKARLGANDAAVDDEDLDLFLRCYKRSNLELVIGSLALLGIVAFVNILLTAPS